MKRRTSPPSRGRCYVSRCSLVLRRAFLFAVVLVSSLASILLASTARAEDYTIRDRLGNRNGSIQQNPSGSYSIRDRSGMTTGRIERGIGGQWVLRDIKGQTTGRLDERPDGGYVIRDPKGGRIGTAEPSLAGQSYILRDRKGQKTGSVETK